MIGQTISHYTILSKLGEGGMGVVYKAEDMKLRRTVALKFLPPELTRDAEARKRFIHEAQAASALDHPNICTLFEIGETREGQIFIAEACYEGESVRQKIGRGPLPVPEAADIAMQAAHGLEKAHEKGIVHRDVKPANIMVTEDGVVKIIDFGLAKLAGQTRLTKAGSSYGTVTYMSPEQARGGEVDQRTDIWSLGVVLYEMVCGSPPFKSDYDQAALYSILNETPQPVSALRPGIPQALDQCISRCLEKNPADRYPDMGALARDLEPLGTAHAAEAGAARPRPEKRGMKKTVWMSGLALLLTLAAVSLITLFGLLKKAPLQVKKLVVLPFENLGPEENDYFTEGITEELTVRLASLSGLGVISRSSASQYVKTVKTIEEIGKELAVDYALGGAVRWAHTSGDSIRVRITPALTRISDRTTLWAGTYDRVIDDIFAVQTDIAQRVVENLGITLLEPDRETVETPPTQNLDAYQAYLRARYYEHRPHFLVDNWLKTVDGYEQAVRLDPGFALAYAELARAHSRLYSYWYDHTESRLAKAKQSMEKALSMAPELPGVKLAMGYYYLNAFKDPQRALEAFTDAEKGMPRNPELLQAKAAVCMMQGRMREGMECSRKALEYSPLDGSIAYDLAEFYWLLRDYEKALETADKVIELDPDDAWSYLIKVFILWSSKGDLEQSRTLLEAVPKDHDWASWTWFWQKIYEKRYMETAEEYSKVPDAWINQKCWAMPNALFAAFAYKCAGQNEKSLHYYTIAKSLLEAEAARFPDDPRFHSSLGIAFAHLGEKEKAIREGLKAVELLPISKDAFYGIPYVEDLAFIYTAVGETDSALKRLDFLLSIPSWISPVWLTFDPQWDALRGLPGFVRLIKK